VRPAHAAVSAGGGHPRLGADSALPAFGAAGDNGAPFAPAYRIVTLQELLAFAGRHPLLSTGLAVLTLAIIGNELMQLMRGFKAVRPAALTELINRGNALVVDLRPANDFEKGHIPGAKNVLPSQFDPENKRLAAARALPVVLVCKDGQASSGAAKRLKKAGFEQVYVLEGGIGGWQQADLPLVKGRA